MGPFRPAGSNLRIKNTMYRTVIPTDKNKNGHTAHFNFYGRGDRIRTCDPLHPMQVLYQAELHPEQRNDINAPK